MKEYPVDGMAKVVRDLRKENPCCKTYPRRWKAERDTFSVHLGEDAICFARNYQQDCRTDQSKQAVKHLKFTISTRGVIPPRGAETQGLADQSGSSLNTLANQSTSDQLDDKLSSQRHREPSRVGLISAFGDRDFYVVTRVFFFGNSANRRRVLPV